MLHKYWIGITIVFTCSILIWSFSKEERGRFLSPDGKYEAVVTRNRHLSITFMALPGSGSDYPCLLSIYEKRTNQHMGTAPVFIASLAFNVIWEKDGAYIDVKPGPEWDFQNRTCTYYDHLDNLVSGL